jgi:bisphosphoglycerate-independent phosphoglycerate mutase (AlkP superfamily)
MTNLRALSENNLSAAGLRVGLSPDAAGNAEVGHLNIGAGRIVQTDVSRIAESIKNGGFFENIVLKNAFARARANDSAVHLIGLLSDGDVHANRKSVRAAANGEERKHQRRFRSRDFRRTRRAAAHSGYLRRSARNQNR